MTDREKELTLLLRLVMQKSKRERAANDELNDAHHAIVAAWREPEGSETMLRLRERMRKAEARLRHDRCMAESAERIAEEYLDLPVTDGPAVTLTTNTQRVA